MDRVDLDVGGVQQAAVGLTATPLGSIGTGLVEMLLSAVFTDITTVGRTRRECRPDCRRGSHESVVQEIDGPVA